MSMNSQNPVLQHKSVLENDSLQTPRKYLFISLSQYCSQKDTRMTNCQKICFCFSRKQTGDNEQFHARTEKAFSLLHQGGKNSLKNDLAWTLDFFLLLLPEIMKKKVIGR